jgi:hypothetical protein
VRVKLPQIKDIVLTKYPVGTDIALTRYLLDALAEEHMDHVVRGAEISQREDYVLWHLIFSMRSYLLKGPQGETRWLSVDIPSTWWDHLKHDFARAKPWQRWIAARLSTPNYRTESKSVETLVRLCPHNDSYLSEKPYEHFYFLNWEDQ